MFDRMLNELNVVITPGSGFGSNGEGYIRISAFNSRENAEEVARRLPNLNRLSGASFQLALRLNAQVKDLRHIAGDRSPCSKAGGK